MRAGKWQLSSQTQVMSEIYSLHEGNDFSCKVSRAKVGRSTWITSEAPWSRCINA